MSKIVKRNIVVVLVDLVKPFPESRRRDVELVDEVKLNEHALHQMQDLVIFVVVRVEGRQSKCHFYVVRQCCVAYLQKLLLHVAVLWEAGLAIRRRVWSV